MSSRRYDKRDIPAVAHVLETAGKVVNDRGVRAWRQAGRFDPGGVGSRALDAGTGGTQVDEDGVPIIGIDPTGNAAVEGRDSFRDRYLAALAAADIAAQRLIDLTDEFTQVHAGVKPDDARGWCPVCMAAGEQSKSAIRTDGSVRLRDSKGRCNSCIKFFAEHGFDQPAEVIRRKKDGRRWSASELDAVLNRARREHELEARRRRDRADAADSSVPTSCPSTITRNGIDVECAEHVAHLGGGHEGDHWAVHNDETIRWPNHTHRAAANE